MAETTTFEIRNGQARSVWSVIGSITLDAVIVAAGLLAGAIIGLVVADMSGWLEVIGGC